MKSKWKQMLEELEVQLALGRAEGRDAFEEQKRKLKLSIAEARTKLDDFQSLGEEKLHRLKVGMEKAELQLALGKAEGRDAFQEQKSKIENALSELRSRLHEASNEGNEKFEALRKDIEPKLEIFWMRLDIARLHFALGKAEAEKDWIEMRNELKGKLREVKEGVEDLTDDAEENWEDFTSDLKSSFKKVQKQLDKLFS